MDWFAELPYATGDLPGIGGRIKVNPEDFEVEEIPAYHPSGSGDHLFLWLEKRGLPAETLVSHVARQLSVSRNDVGCAGLKDTHAVTRQYVSVPASALTRLPAVNSDKVRVLRHGLHGNKLRTGHLRGNTFRLVVRGCADHALARAQAICTVLARDGLPNFYGNQRFGRGGETLNIGLQLLRGENVRVKGLVRRLALSSVQSALFNRCLSNRMESRLLHTVLDGEVLQVVASGGPFYVDDVAREQARYDAREVVPAGPMFGPKMKSAQRDGLAREAALLEDAGLSMEQFVAQGKLTQGTRRAMLVWPEDLQVEAVETAADEAEAVRVSFGLPSGSYATGILRELCKTAAD